MQGFTVVQKVDKDERFAIAANIQSRRQTLGLSTAAFASMLDIPESDVERLEAGELYFAMPGQRIEALILLQDMEERQVGSRKDDAKEARPSLRCVK